jgi:hypothetical protein
VLWSERDQLRDGAQIAALFERVLDKLGLGSAIEVVCGNETALAGLEYDSVMVAALAEPKKDFSGMSDVWSLRRQKSSIGRTAACGPLLCTCGEQKRSRVSGGGAGTPD